MIIIGDDLSGIQELKDFLSQQFEMKDLGHFSYFLGLEITHSIDGLYITQAKYASELYSYLEPNLLIARLLILQLSLMHIWLPQEGNHYLIPLFIDAWLAI